APLTVSRGPAQHRDAPLGVQLDAGRIATVRACRHVTGEPNAQVLARLPCLRLALTPLGIRTHLQGAIEGARVVTAVVDGPRWRAIRKGLRRNEVPPPDQCR